MDVIPGATELTPTGKIRFGDLLKTLRESVGLTQRELFWLAGDDKNKELGTGPVTAISHWEDGRRAPMPAQLYALLRVFDEKGVSDTDRWSLVEAAAVEHHRYTGFLALLPPRASRETKWTMFETWVATFPER